MPDDFTPPTAELDPEIVDRLTRRSVLHRAGVIGAGAALTSAPLTLAATASTAFGQGNIPKDVVKILNFALTLEYLEDTFYKMGNKASGLIPSKRQIIFKTIGDDETKHVEFLKNALKDQAVDKPGFDFTAGGMFKPFDEFAQFTLLSQAFEDTGVRAYKGQAPNLLKTPDVLKQALTIHSVEARHAAIVRRLNGFDSWIAGDQPKAPDPVKPVYAGMGETKQFGVNLPDVVPKDITTDQITEAFDEPLDMGAVLKIVKPFLK